MFYVYEWFNMETKEVFYVGKGKGKRYKALNGRSKRFMNYINHNECQSIIIKQFINENEAFNYEKERIIELKKIGQCSCNIHQGGFGGVEYIWDNERRKKYSTHNIMKSEIQKKRMKESNPMYDKDISKCVAKKKSKPCIINGVRYESLIDAGKKLNRFPTQIGLWCKRGYDNLKQPCRYVGDEQKDIVYKITNSRAVIVDGKIFDSVRSASKYLEVCPETIIRSIKKNKSIKGHKCEYDNQHPSHMKP